MRFESKEDLSREEEAIKWFVGKCGEGYEYLKLDRNNAADYLVFKRNIFYPEKIEDIMQVEVKGRLKSPTEMYPLPLAVRKIHRLSESEYRSVIIWACEVCYVVGQLDMLVGGFKMGGRKPRKGSTNDIEPMVYFPEQKNLRVFDR